MNAVPIVLPAEKRARVRKVSITSKSAQPAPNGDAAWTRHLRSCTACWAAASGQDGTLSFCPVGVRLMDQLGA